MAEKKLYDNLFKVIKANSGPFTTNDIVKTEILDLQIPRGYAARIRKVIFCDTGFRDQLDQIYMHTYGCLVLDPDDENSFQIPDYTVDHDVACDFEHYYIRFEEDTTPNGIAFLPLQKTQIEFAEDLDVVTVRNPRFNSMTNGIKGDGSYPPQTHIEVYFTYERVSMDLYSKLLGIS